MPDIAAQIHAAFEHPEVVLARLALYESAEKKKRHDEYNMSILRYALAGYVTSATDFPDKAEAAIDVTDEGVTVTVSMGRGKSKQRVPVEVAYPTWLGTFFEDDDAFDLLLTTSVTPLAEALDMLREHVELWAASGSEDKDEPETSAEIADEIIEELDDDEAEEEHENDAGEDDAPEEESDPDDDDLALR